MNIRLNRCSWESIVIEDRHNEFICYIAYDGIDFVNYKYQKIIDGVDEL